MRLLLLVPIDGVYPLSLPSTATVFDSVSVLIQHIHRSGLGQPFSVFVHRSHCEHKMNVGIPIARIVEAKIADHTALYKLLTAVVVDKVKILLKC